jgi:hypothetical protein
VYLSTMDNLQFFVNGNFENYRLTIRNLNA